MTNGWLEHLEHEAGRHYTPADEAVAGARWVREDGRPCPCGGSGWLLTMNDVFVPCGACPLGPHPEENHG